MHRRTVPLVSFALLVASAAVDGAEPVGQARNLSGSVGVKHRDQGDFTIVVVASGESQTVFNYDMWKTGDDSSCEIFLDNGSIFILKPLSIVLVKIDRAEKKVTVKLEAGSIKVLTVNSPDFLTTVLSPSGFVTTQGGSFVNRVRSEGELHVENESGQVSVTHGYGTTLVLGDGQGVDLATDFNDPRRIFTVSIPQDNPGAVTAHVVEHVHIELPPGSTASIENNMVPGQGGTLMVESASGNLNQITLTVGPPDDVELTHSTSPGERVTVRFESDPGITIFVGDQTPSEIYTPEPDNALDNVGDILAPQVIVVAPVSAVVIIIIIVPPTVAPTPVVPPEPPATPGG